MIILRQLFALCVLALVVFASSIAYARAYQSKSEEQPFTVEYYYKVKWGYADEFLRLFKKNHFPVLQKQIESGRILQVTGVRPRYHSTEDGRWDYRVTIVFKNAQVAMDSSGEDAIIKRLYPDQETFRREEQRRFDILIAHWDVPLLPLPLDK